MEKEENNEIRSIIFDVGGVLFETNWKSIKKDIMKKYGFSIFLYSDYPKDVHKKFKGLETGHYSFKDVIKFLSKRKDIKNIVKDYKKFYCRHQKLNKPLIKMLKKLRKNYRLFYLSNINDVHLEANRERGVFKSFKKGYGSCEVGFKKPDKRIFYFILKRYNLEHKKTLFIDDKDRNIKTARNLGMKTILFRNNKQLVKDLKKEGVRI